MSDEKDVNLFVETLAAFVVIVLGVLLVAMCFIFVLGLVGIIVGAPVVLVYFALEYNSILLLIGSMVLAVILWD